MGSVILYSPLPGHRTDKRESACTVRSCPYSGFSSLFSNFLLMPLASIDAVRCAVPPIDVLLALAGLEERGVFSTGRETGMLPERVVVGCLVVTS